jgi:hypothetical protein
MEAKQNESFFEREIKRIEAELAVPEAQVRAKQRDNLIEFFRMKYPTEDPEKLAVKYPTPFKQYGDDLHQYYLASRRRNLEMLRTFQERFQKAGFSI